MASNPQRYFFTVTDGQSVALPLCIDLPGLSAARLEAVKLACERMADDPDRFWKTREWQVTVTDDRGLNLFSLMILASDAPAVNGR